MKKLTLELGSKFPYIDTDVPFEKNRRTDIQKIMESVINDNI